MFALRYIYSEIKKKSYRLDPIIGEREGEKQRSEVFMTSTRHL